MMQIGLYNIIVTAENNPYGAYLDSKGYNDGFSKAQTVN